MTETEMHDFNEVSKQLVKVTSAYVDVQLHLENCRAALKFYLDAGRVLTKLKQDPEADLLELGKAMTLISEDGGDLAYSALYPVGNF